MKEALIMFLAALIGAGVSAAFISKYRRPPFGAAVIDVIAISITVVSPMLMKVWWPELTRTEGFAIIVTAVLLIYVPASLLAERIRTRRNSAA